jgi:hypothetical protein
MSVASKSAVDFLDDGFFIAHNNSRTALLWWVAEEPGSDSANM